MVMFDDNDCERCRTHEKAYEVLHFHCKQLETGLDSLKTQRDALLKGCKDMLLMLDEGLLVRNTSKDADPNWAMKALALVQRLQAIQDAIALSEADQ